MSSFRAKSKNFATDVLSKGFKPEKCKTSLKMAVARIKLLRNKREAQVKHMRRDLAQLLESGQDQTARIRVEHVIREEKTMSAYELVELYCELIVARLPIIESQKKCPIDLKEAVASVIFASPRCADVPELMDICKHFTAKYGKEFINSALEVRPDCGVSRMMVEKLSARAPDVETKIKILTAIAQEHNIKWDSKGFEEQFQMPREDLLDGPNTFASASKIPRESSNANLFPVPSQTNEAANKKFENDESKPMSFNASHTNTSTHSMPQSELRVPENGRGNREATNSSPTEESSSLNHSNWNLEFKDATSAAQAAAESAERASIAARAAAELASHGNVSRQYPTSSRESPTYYTRDQGPVKSMGSKLRDEQITEESVLGEGDELKNSLDLKQQSQDFHRYETIRGSSKGVPESTNTGYEDARSGSSSSSPSLRSEASIHDGASEVNFQKANEMAHGHTESYTTAGHVEQIVTGNKHESGELVQRSTNDNYSRPASYYNESKFEDDNVKDSNFQMSEYFDDQKSVADFGDHEEPAFGGNSAVVFDDYGSDTDDHMVFGTYNEGKLLDSFLSHQRNEDSDMSSSVNSWSPKQQGSRSLKKVNSSRLPSVTEINQSQYSETIKEVSDPSHFNVDLPVAFDDSDDFSSGSEDEMDKEALEPNRSLHTQRSSTRGLLSAESGHGLTSSFLSETKEIEASKGSLLPTISSASRENSEADLSYGDKSWKRDGSSGLTDNQPSSRNGRCSRNSSSAGQGLIYHPKDDEPPTSGSVLSTEEAGTKDKFEMQLSPSSVQGSEIPNDSIYESGQSLNLGRLTGGFKNKGFPRVPYIPSPSVDASFPSKQSSSDAPSISERPLASPLGKLASDFEIIDEEKHEQESSSKSYLSSQRTSRGYIDSRSDKAEGSVSHHAGSKGYRGEASLSLNKAVEDASSIIMSLDVLQEDRISGNLDIPVQELSSQRSHRKDHKGFISESSVEYSDPDSNVQHSHADKNRSYRGNASMSSANSTNASPTLEKSTVPHPSRTLMSPEFTKQDMYDKTSHMKAYKELSSKMQATYFDQESDGEGDPELCNAVGSRGSRDVKLSRRTRVLPSDTRKGDLSRLADHSSVPSISELETKPSHTSSSAYEPLPKRGSRAMNLEDKQSSGPSQRNSSAEQPTAMPSKTGSPKLSQIELKQSLPANTGSPKTSSLRGGLPSRESSFKSASHVHPKLPDYDALAAHFQSLRSNRRTE